MTLADELEKLLKDGSLLSPAELYLRLGRAKSKVRVPQVVATVLRANPQRFVEVSPGFFQSSAAVPVTASADVGGEDWISLELRLRAQLRGRRMVSEIGLDAKLLTEVETALDQALTADTDPLDAGDKARALIAVCLVAHGIYRYRAGTFWNGFAVGAINQSYGRAFARAIRLLRLETFDSMVEADNAIKYVAPILAHGGIPKYCLDDYFKANSKSPTHDPLFCQLSSSPGRRVWVSLHHIATIKGLFRKAVQHGRTRDPRTGSPGLRTDLLISSAMAG